MTLREFLHHPLWTEVTTLAGGVGFVLAALFVFSYHRETGGTWRRLGGWACSQSGRYMMTRNALLMPLFAIIVLNRLAGDWTGRPAATAVLVLVFALTTILPYRLLESREARARREQANREATNG